MAHSDPIAARPSPRRASRGLLGSRWRRLGAALSVLLVGITVMALVPGLTRASSVVGVKTYYLGLGDSLAFGYQPNFDWSHGYVQQWYTNLRTHGSRSLTNYGCPGETSTSFIYGGCPNSFLVHNFYAGAQLTAAVNFIKSHAGKVSPVSLDIGANDMLPDINTSTCAVSSSWESDLATMDSNIRGIILPTLITALTDRRGRLTGDLVMMNYYNPFQLQCPSDTTYMAELNAHLAADWTAGWQSAGFSAAPYSLADVYTAFGGTTTQNDCTYTWMCSTFHDIHATGGQAGEPGNGYGVVTTAFEQDTGY